MRFHFLILLSLAMFPWQIQGARGDETKNLGFKVPEGFSVTLYAGDNLASDIHSMTVDAKGRIVVAGKGFIKILHDTKKAGQADQASLFADFPKSGAHGMVFDGPDLICDGDLGIHRLHDTKSMGRCDKVSEVWFPTKNDGEHAANGIVRGPDGWYYLITGNDAGISRLHANGPATPIKSPNAGAVVRISPDGKSSEIVAHGFRNPYDLAFNHLGHLFTVDADGERVHHMPYYAPTRLFDIAQGMHHGWLLPGWQGSWSRPPCWPDNVERLVEIGRGSPTGLVVYRHRAFPERYRNGVFSACWTFGKIYFFPLTRSGSTYTSKMELFMQTTGDVGFAPTDMVVGPDGDLFIAIGGRGTRGSVFRVHYQGKPPPPPGQGDPLRTILAADEPLSSWSRASWVPAARKLGAKPFLEATTNARLPLEERIRAVEIVTELFGGLPIDLVKKHCAKETEVEMIGRVIWSLSRTQTGPDAVRLMEAVTASPYPRAARAAWEALACLPPGTKCHPDWQAGLTSLDRRIRAAAIAVARGAGRHSFLEKYSAATGISSQERLALALVVGLDGSDVNSWLFYQSACLRALEQTKVLAPRLEAVRLLQIALGDVVADQSGDKAFVGYLPQSINNVSAKNRRELAEELTKLFPTNDADLDFEMARLLGMLAQEVPDLLFKISSKWLGKSAAEEDIHYLLVMARLPGKRSATVTARTAAALNGIQVKLAAIGAKPSDQVPGILEAVWDRLQGLDPALPLALVSDPAFGLPGHALYANKLPAAVQPAAARKLLEGIAKLDEDQARAAWNPELIRLAATLPSKEALPILRGQFADPRLADTITLFLAKEPRLEDRALLIEALGSSQASVVGAAADALHALPKPKEAQPMDLGKVVRSLRRMETQKADVKTPRALVQLLRYWTGRDGNLEEAAAWVSWFTKTHPREAAALPGLASADFATWKKRLDQVDWDKGDARRGEIVFERKNCFRCHGEGRRLGPDLAGIAQRFSRDDLFTAIIDPNKDISPAYIATTIITTSGKIHNGMVIYSSPDLYLLQTTPDTTLRFPRAEIQLVQPSAISFMPAGLLDDASNGDLADLYAYLRGLRKK